MQILSIQLRSQDKAIFMFLTTFDSRGLGIRTGVSVSELMYSDTKTLLVIRTMYFPFCSDTETPVLLGYRDHRPCSDSGTAVYVFQFSFHFRPSNRKNRCRQSVFTSSWIATTFRAAIFQSSWWQTFRRKFSLKKISRNLLIRLNIHKSFKWLLWGHFCSSILYSYFISQY